MRRELLDGLKRSQTAKGGIPASLNPATKAGFEYWSNGQALTGIFLTPELSEADARQLLKGFEEHFESGSAIEGDDGKKYGWFAHPKEKRTQAEPAIWTVAALAAALGHPGLLTGEARERALARLAYAQEVLKTYRPDDEVGGTCFQIRKTHTCTMFTRPRWLYWHCWRHARQICLGKAVSKGAISY